MRKVSPRVMRKLKTVSLYISWPTTFSQHYGTEGTSHTHRGKAQPPSQHVSQAPADSRALPRPRCRQICLRLGGGMVLPLTIVCPAYLGAAGLAGVIAVAVLQAQRVPQGEEDHAQAAQPQSHTPGGRAGAGSHTVHLGCSSQHSPAPH